MLGRQPKEAWASRYRAGLLPYLEHVCLPKAIDAWPTELVFAGNDAEFQWMFMADGACLLSLFEGHRGCFLGNFSPDASSPGPLRLHPFLSSYPSHLRSKHCYHRSDPIGHLCCGKVTSALSMWQKKQRCCCSEQKRTFIRQWKQYLRGRNSSPSIAGRKMFRQSSSRQCTDGDPVR